MRGLQQIWRGDWDGDGDIDYSFPDVSLFPTDYWSNCLTVGYNYEYPNKVIWSKVPGSATITKYRLYKTITQNSEPPSENQFTFITETSSTEFYYDDIVDADENGNRVVHYFVKGYYQSAIESGWTQRTNIGSITISYSWQSALNIGTEDDHPRLVWYEHPNHPNANSFKVYRRINYGSWSIIQTTSNKFYVDQQFTVVNNPSNTVYYRVSAVDNGQETDYTNTVNIEVGKLPFKEIGEESIQVSKYELSQNYPNPFNPNTNISYSIPENAFVTLKIYDVLGNEVEVLINDQKEPGNYQIDFNASELSSGIYYYTLTAGNFTSTKKMSLIK
ncbi:MAG: T9SS type A sorting domain-containing protein [Ignavibacteriales bacterium]|nr:T9SS type A sorting domain-containing protein [Ignavibacteriales bacterium]